MGQSNPRQITFAAKSLAYVSILIFFKEPLRYIRQHSIWAILTVIFEFSIGATLSKGFNRALGTVSAAILALGSICVGWGMARSCSLSSYVKLHPSMKPYEYGFRVFMLTFSIVLTSHFVRTAVSRLLLVGVRASICLIVNLCNMVRGRSAQTGGEEF
ncbi:hypothetical protein R6Q57_027148 [Mikania cordata]